MIEASAGYCSDSVACWSDKGGIRIQVQTLDSVVPLRAYKSGTMKKDTSRNLATCVVTLVIIGSVLFSAVESVRVSTKRVKGEYLLPTTCYLWSTKVCI